MKVKSCLYCGGKELTYVTHRSDNNGILRCSRCRVMMVENISDDTESLYTADYFEKPKDTKSGYTNYLSSPAANIIGKYGFSRLFAREPGNHLDLGCADGSLIEIFNSAGYNSRGLEISKDAVNIANTKGLDVRFSRLHTFPKNLPRSKVITAFDLLEHADKPGNVLKEVYKNLEDDGYFVFSTLSVKRNDPTDYWYNHSLEHYVYYNEESLRYILSDVFGKENFAFVEIEINGVAEFWGFGKKGKLNNEARIIDNIASGAFDKKDSEGAYLVSLFYNQLSKFSESEKIIKYFKDKWPIDTRVQAEFYNLYFQGRFEVLLKGIEKNQHLVGASNSVFWQALAFVKEQFFQIREAEYNQEIFNLREQLFKTRDELHSLKNSRIMGRIIKARDMIGNPYTLPFRAAHKTRRTVAQFVPDSIRLPLMKSLRSGRNSLKKKVSNYHNKVTNTIIITNTLWNKTDPLVSVVIPYYNRADTIDDTLDSLRKQTFQNFETIIVDDHSSESESIKKLKSIEKEGIKVIYQKTNQGVAAARNKGIEATKGKYVICLDSDDMLDETFIEKATITLETNPDAALVTTYQDMFGVVSELFEKHPYDPLRLIEDNMVITAAQFRKVAWETSGGYKSNLGYEDWDFWLQLAENGFWGKLIPEPLFKYRTSMQSRYVEDKDVHWNNLKKIRSLHPDYKSRVRSLIADRKFSRQVVDSQTAFINLSNPTHYKPDQNKKPNVLITVPWMDFGGVSTLLNNFTREVSNNVNLHFITGLSSKNEWEYKFKEITPRVYHMPNMFEENPAFQLEFVSNYIKTREIDILHLVHNGFIYPMLDELKRRHPKIKIISTVFNDRAPYLVQSIEQQQYIDIFTTDNLAVGEIYKSSLKSKSDIRVIPNGIDIETIFNPKLFDREKLRKELKILPDDTAVFYIGRLSEEKNPDLFVEAVKTVIDHGVKNVEYFMIGDGPMRNEIQKKVFSIKDRPINYLGYQSDIAEYLAAADVFVLPSAVEGFPLSILEAMAMNVATVATNVGAVSDVIVSGKNGIIVDKVHADSIAQSMEKILSDRKLLDKIKSQTRIDVEKKYSNAILGKNYRKLYKG